MDTSPIHLVTALPESRVSLQAAFLRGLPSEATRRVYRQVLNAYASFLGLSDVLTAGRREIESYRAMLEAEGKSPATVSKHLAAVCGLYNFAFQEGLIDRNPAMSVRRPKVSARSPRRALEPLEVRSLMGSIDTETLVGLRDWTALVTLLAQGLRVSELLRLTVEDLVDEGGHHVAVVHGKGATIYRVPLAGATFRALHRWLQAADIQSGPIFLAVTRSGTVVSGKAMTQQAFWKRLRLHAKRAGITRPIHAHLMRHTAITQALASGVELHRVQDFARHASPVTTRRYDSHRDSLDNPSAHIVADALGLGDVK